MDPAPAAPAVRRIKAPREEEIQPPADEPRFPPPTAFTAMTAGSPDTPTPSHSPSPDGARESCAPFPEAGTSPPSPRATNGIRPRPDHGPASGHAVCRCAGCSAPVPAGRPRHRRMARSLSDALDLAGCLCPAGRSGPRWVAPSRRRLRPCRSALSGRAVRTFPGSLPPRRTPSTLPVASVRAGRSGPRWVAPSRRATSALPVGSVPSGCLNLAGRLRPRPSGASSSLGSLSSISGPVPSGDLHLVARRRRRQAGATLGGGLVSVGRADPSRRCGPLRPVPTRPVGHRAVRWTPPGSGGPRQADCPAVTRTGAARRPPRLPVFARPVSARRPLRTPRPAASGGPAGHPG